MLAAFQQYGIQPRSLLFDRNADYLGSGRDHVQAL